MAAAEPILSNGIAALLAAGGDARRPQIARGIGATGGVGLGTERGSAPAEEGTARVADHGFVVLDVAGSVDAAERALAAYRPRLAVLVLDPPLPGATVGEACDRLITGNPHTASLVLLVRPDGALVRRVCRSGARAVFATDIEPDELGTVLRQIDEGDVVIQPSLVKHLVRGREGESGVTEGTHTTEAYPTLNNRELTALQLLARGYTSKQIAPLLNSSAKAVDMTIERATRRLGASTRSQAVAIALRHGLIT